MPRKKKSSIEKFDKVSEGKKYPIECEVIEKYYFSNPKDCKKDFDIKKSIGYEKLVNGRYEKKQGHKSAYIIVKKHSE